MIPQRTPFETWCKWHGIETTHPLLVVPTSMVSTQLKFLSGEGVVPGTIVVLVEDDDTSAPYFRTLFGGVLTYRDGRYGMPVVCRTRLPLHLSLLRVPESPEGTA